MGACVVIQPAPTNTTAPADTKTNTKTEPEEVAETPKETEAAPEKPNAWTAEQKKREVDSCVIDKSAAKYSYEEANRNADKVIAELQTSGAIEACIESAGLKE